MDFKETLGCCDDDNWDTSKIYCIKSSGYDHLTTVHQISKGENGNFQCSKRPKWPKQ